MESLQTQKSLKVWQLIVIFDIIQLFCGKNKDIIFQIFQKITSCAILNANILEGHFDRYKFGPSSSVLRCYESWPIYLLDTATVEKMKKKNLSISAIFSWSKFVSSLKENREKYP